MDLRPWCAPTAGGRGGCRALARVALVALVGLSGTACGSETGGHAAPAATSATSSTTLGATTGPPSLPVVACPSTYGGPTGTPGPPLPAEVAVHLAPGLAGQLSYYSSDTRTLAPIVGPRGWECQVQVGADGTTGVDVHPPGAASGPGRVAGQPAVNAASDSACQGCVFATVCAFVPQAAAELGYSGFPCPALPSDVMVSFLRGSATASGPVVDDVIAYSEPADPTTTSGVVLYRHQSGTGGSASQETCNLPAAEHGLCAAILRDFITAAWLMRR